MKIGILTITPNIGFGGLLQAYALQSTLEKITGAEVEIINYRANISIRQHVSYFVYAVLRRLLKHEFTKYTLVSEYKYRSQNLQYFHSSFLKYSSIVYPGMPFYKYVNENYDVVVVGSDQVWRPKYVLSIADYFLAGINGNIKKISYAASLGVENWEFNKRQTETCASLIKSFDYVSVREKEAILLIKNNLKYAGSIHWDLDPTMLAEPSIYKEHCTNDKVDVSCIFTYILDGNYDKERIVCLIANVLGKKNFSFNTGAEDSSKQLKERIAPPLVDWLSGIYYSDFVITDSFHGCVFSIIFNKPFVVYVNKLRGASRFTSLLSMLGLENRMIYSTDEFDNSILESSINWNSINDLIDKKRRDILNRLNEVINQDKK